MGITRASIAARLYTDARFKKQLDQTFTGNYKLEFHLAPPVLNGELDADGRPRKKVFGPWIMRLYGVLARMKRIRGGPLDVFGYTAERKMERELIGDYRQRIQHIATSLNKNNLNLAIEIADAPDSIRGYGPVKLAAIRETELRQNELLARFNAIPDTATGYSLDFQPVNFKKPLK